MKPEELKFLLTCAAFMKILSALLIAQILNLRINKPKKKIFIIRTESI